MVDDGDYRDCLWSAAHEAPVKSEVVILDSGEIGSVSVTLRRRSHIYLSSYRGDSKEKERGGGSRILAGEGTPRVRCIRRYLLDCQSDGRFSSIRMRLVSMDVKWIRK